MTMKNQSRDVQPVAFENSRAPDLPALNDALGTLQGELERLRSAAEHIEQSKEAAREAVEAARHVGQASAGLTAQTDTLIGRLDKVDFPSRLDKLDATVSALHTGFQLIQGRLDSVERNVQDATERALESGLQMIKGRLDSLGQAQVETDKEVAEVGRNIEAVLSQSAASQFKVLKQLRVLLFVLLGAALALLGLELIR